MKIKIEMLLKDGEKLREDIVISGHNLKSFSRKIGISHNYLVQIANKDKNPGPVTAKKICDGLNKQIGEYFFVRSKCCSTSKAGTATGTENK